MSDLTPPQIDVPDRYFSVGWGSHLLLTAALVPTPLLLAAPVVGDGSFLGISDAVWVPIAVAVPIAHQVLVAFGWRAQLCFGTFTRWFGAHDLGVWGALFLPLLVARPLTVLALALADRGSAGLPTSLAMVVGLVLALPAAYTLWSVHRYFGIPRAIGGDHFREHYRQLPMVTEGAFAWTNNAMYGIAFLGLWAIAVGLDSRAALGVVLFQHAYIWVHWYCTEKPDLALLYDSAGSP